MANEAITRLTSCATDLAHQIQVKGAPPPCIHADQFLVDLSTVAFLPPSPEAWAVLVQLLANIRGGGLAAERASVIRALREHALINPSGVVSYAVSSTRQAMVDNVPDEADFYGNVIALIDEQLPKVSSRDQRYNALLLLKDLEALPNSGAAAKEARVRAQQLIDAMTVPDPSPDPGPSPAPTPAASPAPWKIALSVAAGVVGVAGTTYAVMHATRRDRRRR